MEYCEIQGIKTPKIGLGTSGIGGTITADTSQDAEEVQAIRDAIGMGYRLIDTAEGYGDGHCEELIGHAINDHDKSDLFIVSKVSPEHLRYDDVLTACEASLERLGTTSIDLYLLHAPNPDVPIEETMRAMDTLKDQGLIKHIGVSNFSVAQLEAAMQASRHPILANQIHYALSVRDKSRYVGLTGMEERIVPYCQENGILVMAECPLEKGVLVDTDHPLLVELAQTYQKTQAQVAIRWLIQQPGVITMPKSVNPSHQKENLGAVGWELSETDMKRLSETDFSRYRRPVK